MKRMENRPLIIAHRGASGYRPEHTLEAYELAIRMGADYIEPDVVITRDGVLVVRHENELSDTTDVAARPEFESRRTTKEIDGHKVSGWFCEDFGLEELKKLRARERLPARDHSFDGVYEIPTLQEVMDLAKRWSEDRGRVVGVYPETKHPSYFASIGLPLEAPLIELMEANWFRRGSDPVYIQSFETENLKRLSEMTRLPLVQLMGDAHERPFELSARGDPRTWGDLTAPGELARIAGYAFAVGCSKRLLVPTGPDGRLLPPTNLVHHAHGAGLNVHAWTFRSDATFLAPEYEGDPGREYEQFSRLGVDGFFTDFPDTAVAARDRFWAARS